MGFRIPPLAPESMQFRCGQVNRCHAGLISHASGVQLASPQPISLGESFNGRMAGLQPADEGSTPSSSTICQDGRCGQGTSLKSWTSTFDSCSWRANPFRNGPSSNGTGHRFPKPEIPVRVRMGRPTLLELNFGNEEDGNPLRLERRDHWVRIPGSRLNFFRGSQAGKAPHC